MHQLLLLRHAKSSWDDANQPDRDRPLNRRGREAAALMRQTMRDLGLTPDLVLVSSARRTLETLEALEPWPDTPLVEPMDALYLATAGQLLDALREVPETVRSVLLIGHNPGMHDLALTLCADTAAPAARQLAAQFPTAALAEFTIGSPWSRVMPGSGRLVRFLTPRALAGSD
jgi:phosphohistidine phosphatase